jgi:transposase
MAEAVENIDYKSLYELLLPIHQVILKSFQEQQQDNKLLRSQVSSLQYELHRVIKLLSGFKTERFIPGSANHQNELGLFFEQAPESTSLVEAKKITYVRTSTPARDKQAEGLFAERLRRETVVVEPDEDISECTRTGEKVVEKLAYKPGELYVKQTILPSYACPVEGKPDKPGRCRLKCHPVL